MLTGPSWPVVAAAAALVAASLLADAVLARRFAGGSGSMDEASCKRLVTSLTCNTIFGFACVALPAGRFAVPGLAPVALALAACGLILRYAAVQQLGRLFTWRVAILDDHALRTHGLYRWVRHPSYLGGLLAAGGLLLALENAVPMVAFACSHLPLVIHRVLIEERVLAAHFGPAWDAYAARTWRLVPGIW